MKNINWYEGKLLNLKEDVCFFFFRHDNDILGKLFYIKSRKIHAKPNKVACMFLYLLARDERDDIQFETFMRLINDKFTEYKISDIEKFLNDLKDNLQILDTGLPTENNLGTTDPDPMGLFAGTKIAWESPNINVRDNKFLTDKVSHYYSRPEPPGKKVNGGTIRR